MSSKKAPGIIALEKQNHSNQEVMFQDECRFGTMTALGREWKPKGEDFVVKVKQGRESVYSFAAAAPASGKIIGENYEKSNTERMNDFLNKVALDMQGRNILMILDRAAWHTTTKLKIPSSIKLLFLPPTSPQLNPVEHLWKLVRSERFHNVIFDTIGSVYATVSEAIRKRDIVSVKSLCSCTYL